MRSDHHPRAVRRPRLHRPARRQPGVLQVTLHAPTGDITLDADIVLFTGGNDFENCGYG